MVASRGHTTPTRRSGHAAAAPTRADSHIFSRGLVCPNRATTAQPNSADRILPSDREMSARSAWRIATADLGRGPGGGREGSAAVRARRSFLERHPARSFPLHQSGGIFYAKPPLRTGQAAPQRPALALLFEHRKQSGWRAERCRITERRGCRSPGDAEGLRSSEDSTAKNLGDTLRFPRASEHVPCGRQRHGPCFVTRKKEVFTLFTS